MQQDTNELGQAVGFPLPDWNPPEWPSREPMTGRFCRLEALDAGIHAADLQAAYALPGGEKTWTYLPRGPFQTMEIFQTWIAEMNRGNDPILFAIVSAATGKAVGLAGYLRIDPPNGSIEVGHLAFSPLLQRTPAATEAMFLMMKRAFALGYRRYEWKCHSLNEPSRAAAKRLGFTFEGTFRQAAVVKGRNRDTAWFSIIDAEWPSLHERFRRWLAPENFDQTGRQRAKLQEL